MKKIDHWTPVRKANLLIMLFCLAVVIRYGGYIEFNLSFVLAAAVVSSICCIFADVIVDSIKVEESR